jgi:hypothetical protein
MPSADTGDPARLGSSRVQGPAGDLWRAAGQGRRLRLLAFGGVTYVTRRNMTEIRV